MKTLNAEVQPKPCDNILGGSMKVLALCALLLIPSLSRAEDGPGSGNGGNLVRIDIDSVMNQIGQNCDKWNSIKFMQQGEEKVCDLIRAKIKVISSSKEKFKIVPKLPLDRTGENFADIPAITFSESKWTANKDNTIAKIGIVLHEYLGLLGLEKTDQYHISKAVMSELQSVSLISSDNPNFMSTMTKVDAMVRKARDCGQRLSDNDRRELADSALVKLRKIIHDKNSSKDEKKAATAKWDSVVSVLDDVNFQGLNAAAGNVSSAISGAPRQELGNTFCKGKVAKKIQKAELQTDDESDDSSGNGPAN